MLVTVGLRLLRSLGLLAEHDRRIEKEIVDISLLLFFASSMRGAWSRVRVIQYLTSRKQNDNF
jgi:hypothetical protein